MGYAEYIIKEAGTWQDVGRWSKRTFSPVLQWLLGLFSKFRSTDAFKSVQDATVRNRASQAMTADPGTYKLTRMLASPNRPDPGADPRSIMKEWMGLNRSSTPSQRWADVREGFGWNRDTAADLLRATGFDRPVAGIANSVLNSPLGRMGPLNKYRQGVNLARSAGISRQPYAPTADTRNILRENMLSGPASKQVRNIGNDYLDQRTQVLNNTAEDWSKLGN